MRVNVKETKRMVSGENAGKVTIDRKAVTPSPASFAGVGHMYWDVVTYKVNCKRITSLNVRQVHR